jgi:phage terminase large subunit
MELEFKTKNQKQLEAAEYWIDNDTEQILFGGAKAGGKSFLGASLIFGEALIYPETHYFIARQELIDLRKFTIPTIYEVFQKWGLKVDDYMSFNGQDSCFNLKNGSKVFLISCRDIPSDPLYERFGSMQMTRGWIEEAGEIAEAAKATLLAFYWPLEERAIQTKEETPTHCQSEEGLDEAGIC